MHAATILVYKSFILKSRSYFFAIIVLIFFWVAEVQRPQNCFKPVPGHLLVREVKVTWPLFPPVVFSVVDMHKASEDNDAQKQVEIFHCLSLPRELFASFNPPSCIGISAVSNCPDNRCTKKQLEECQRGPCYCNVKSGTGIPGWHEPEGVRVLVSLLSIVPAFSILWLGWSGGRSRRTLRTTL